jgi:hypothetical protein
MRFKSFAEIWSAAQRHRTEFFLSAISAPGACPSPNIVHERSLARCIAKQRVVVTNETETEIAA